MTLEFLMILGGLALVAYVCYERGRSDARKGIVTPQLVEQVSMIIVDKQRDPLPGVDWKVDCPTTVNGLRERVRIALLIALENKP